MTENSLESLSTGLSACSDARVKSLLALVTEEIQHRRPALHDVLLEWAADCLAHFDPDTASRLRRETERRLEEAQAAARQREIEALWAYKSALSQRFGQLVRADRRFDIKLWSRDGDVRVYVTEHGYDAFDSDNNELVYYHTGNSRVKPGSLTLGHEPARAVKFGSATQEQLRSLCAEVCTRYPHGFECTTEVSSDSPPSTWPTYFIIWNGRNKPTLYLTGDGSFDSEGYFTLRFDSQTGAQAHLDALKSSLVYPNKESKVVLRISD